LAAPRKIAIIAALEHELRPLLKNWPAVKSHHDGRDFTFYESSYSVAVCSGIGPEPGRRAAEAIIAKYSPELLISAGIAGAPPRDLRVGETIFPATLIDTHDSSRHPTAIENTPLANTPLAKTIVVSCPEIAGAEQKQRLAKAYAAHAVDMEGASVARAAEAHGLPFIAIKTVSDELDFELPPLMRFFREGEFQTARFVLHISIRPWLWLRVFRLARNTKIASENLCAWLRESALTNTIVPGTITEHKP